jgi:Zn-dependent protease
VHWSVLVVVVLVAWSLGGIAFPAAYPGYPAWAYAVVGFLAAVLFLVGLMAHEVSHAVVARRNGVEVDSITLWLFGGVAALHGEADTPGAELRIAGIGPLVSLLFGLASGAAAALLQAAGASRLLVGVLAWLAFINVLLMVFNLIPGAPLDGGRLLRAALWRWRGDRYWAAQTAARAGRTLGLVLIALGLAEVLLTGSIGGLWLALIGWFIAGAAAAEEQQSLLVTTLAGVRVRDVMTAQPETVPAQTTVADLVEHYVLRRRHSTFPVLDGDRLAGVVTLRRVKQLPPGHRPGTLVRDIACPLPETPVAASSELLSELLTRLNEAADGRALVVDDGRLVGIVSPTDVSRAIEQATLRGPAAGGRPVSRPASPSSSATPAPRP